MTAIRSYTVRVAHLVSVRTHMSAEKRLNLQLMQNPLAVLPSSGGTFSTL